MENKFPMQLDDVKFIMAALRQASVKWPGRAEALKRARKKVFVRKSKAGKSIYKYHWQCAKCRRWARSEKSVQVDHIIEIGSFKGDWNEFMARHFPRPVNKFLQVLCVGCHLKKTKAYNAANINWTRKRPL